jgi:GTP-binding protein
VVADYPFTTLVPNLGVVRHAGRVFTVADIPGLIEGAAEGAGLGHRFLRHVERCQAMVFLLSPIDADPPAKALQILRRELAAYNPEMLDRPALIVLAKSDLLGPDAEARAAELSAELGRPVLTVSALTGDGLPRLLDAVAGRFPIERVLEEAVWSPVPE